MTWEQGSFIFLFSNKQQYKNTTRELSLDLFVEGGRRWKKDSEFEQTGEFKEPKFQSWPSPQPIKPLTLSSQSFPRLFKEGELNDLPVFISSSGSEPLRANPIQSPLQMRSQQQTWRKGHEGGRCIRGFSDRSLWEAPKGQKIYFNSWFEEG